MKHRQMVIEKGAGKNNKGIHYFPAIHGIVGYLLHTHSWQL